MSGFISHSLLSNFRSLIQWGPPPLLSSSHHCLLSLFLLNIKSPLIHFENKQTFSLPLFFSPATPPSVFILRPLHQGTHTSAHARTHAHVYRGISEQQLSTPHLNRAFHLRAHRQRMESGRPVSAAGVLLLDLVAQSAMALLISPPPLLLLCSPSRCVGCCLLTPHCVTMRVCL